MIAEVSSTLSVEAHDKFPTTIHVTIYDIVKSRIVMYSQSSHHDMCMIGGTWHVVLILTKTGEVRKHDTYNSKPHVMYIELH